MTVKRFDTLVLALAFVVGATIFGIFFYQARGPAVGGPLGRGAAIVEINPNSSGKKEKK